MTAAPALVNPREDGSHLPDGVQVATPHGPDAGSGRPARFGEWAVCVMKRQAGGGYRRCDEFPALHVGVFLGSWFEGWQEGHVCHGERANRD